MELLFVGIDVSKATLDIAVRPTGETWTSANAPDGIDALVARIAALAPTLVVLEATGRYEAPCAAALATAGVAASGCPVRGGAVELAAAWDPAAEVVARLAVGVYFHSPEGHARRAHERPSVLRPKTVFANAGLSRRQAVCRGHRDTETKSRAPRHVHHGSHPRRPSRWTCAGSNRVLVPL